MEENNMAAAFAATYDGLTITSGLIPAYSVINETEVRLLPTVINIFNEMPFQINIFAIKTNNISKNGNIDFGSVIQNSHTANTKAIGSNFSTGDFSPPFSLMANGSVDPDVNDQNQIANPSVPINNTI